MPIDEGHIAVMGMSDGGSLGLSMVLWTRSSVFGMYG